MTVVALKRRADDHTQRFVHIDDSLFVGPTQSVAWGSLSCLANFQLYRRKV